MATDDPLLATVAGRYASALFDLALEQNSADRIERELSQIDSLLTESADLRRLVMNPVFKADDQMKALGAVLARIGISGTTENFLNVVARNRRLFVLPDMLKAYRRLSARARGEVEAEVTSAVALSDSQLAGLTDALKGSVGKAVRLTTRVDPSLLGGLVVKIGSRMIDSSLKTKLATLKVRLKEVG